MLADWIFGPETTTHGFGTTRLRSLVLDVDTLLDAQTLLNYKMPRSPLGARFSVQPEIGSTDMSRDISGDDVRSLGQYERRRLILSISQEDADGGTDQVIVYFGTANPSVFADKEVSAARDAVVRLLLGEGRPRVIWSNFARLLPLLPALGLAGLFAWAEATTHMVLAVHALGWFVVLLAGIYGVRRLIVLRRSPMAAPGHFIRPESRADTAARRADEKKNLKVALITAPITLAGGFALAVALGLIGF